MSPRRTMCMIKAGVGEDVIVGAGVDVGAGVLVAASVEAGIGSTVGVGATVGADIGRTVGVVVAAGVTIGRPTRLCAIQPTPQASAPKSTSATTSMMICPGLSLDIVSHLSNPLSNTFALRVIAIPYRARDVPAL